MSRRVQAGYPVPLDCTLNKIPPSARYVRATIMDSIDTVLGVVALTAASLQEYFNFGGFTMPAHDIKARYDVFLDAGFTQRSEFDSPVDYYQPDNTQTIIQGVGQPGRLVGIVGEKQPVQGVVASTGLVGIIEQQTVSGQSVQDGVVGQIQAQEDIRGETI